MSSGKIGPETGTGQEPASDLWRYTLARISTLSGRLIYLSSLRNQSSGAYEHHGLARMVGDEQAAETLRRSHARVFQDWLCLNLEQQKADLQDYLAENPAPAAALRSWLDSGSYRNWAPAAALDVEKQLFARDLEILFGLLKREYGGVSPDPGS